MDNRFLNKVVDQIISETMIDYDMEEIQFPFPALPLLTSFFSPFVTLFFRPSSLLSFIPPLFTKHCKNVYGLNEEETEYVWDEYREIIIDKINNGL